MLSTLPELVCCAASPMYSSSSSPEVYPAEAKCPFFPTEKAVFEPPKACVSSNCVYVPRQFYQFRRRLLKRRLR
jgi:hypothetical protein